MSSVSKSIFERLPLTTQIGNLDEESSKQLISELSDSIYSPQMLAQGLGLDWLKIRSVCPTSDHSCHCSGLICHIANKTELTLGDLRAMFDKGIGDKHLKEKEVKLGNLKVMLDKTTGYNHLKEEEINRIVGEFQKILEKKKRKMDALKKKIIHHPYCKFSDRRDKPAWRCPCTGKLNY